MATRPAAGGGRLVDVSPDRLPGWIDRFTARNGFETAWGLVPSTADGVVTLSALNGTEAHLYPPPGAPVAVNLDEFVTVAQEPRRIGLVLARQASVAVG